MCNKKNMILVMGMTLFLVALQSNAAKKEWKHGIVVGTQVDDGSADISGQHKDYEGFVGNNPEVITDSNANILDGIISKSKVLGYNVRYIPKVGWGFEAGIYKRAVKSPRQNVALKHDDGSAFIVQTEFGAADIVVDSPESTIETVDIYFGGLYRFAAIKGITPYVGAGYAVAKGKWKGSYYSGTPGEDPRYGNEGEVDINGSYVGIKMGVDLANGFSIELQQTQHKMEADSFRSFDINGADVDYNINSLNLLYHF